MRLEEPALTLPPLFAEACGYRGKARHVALCWIPEKGELWWSDDGYATLGRSNASVILAQTGERTACRRPPASVGRQEELERRVSAWLDWMSKRRAAESSDDRGRPSKD